MHESRGLPSGPLRLTVPRSAAQLVLLPRLREFSRTYPGITLEIQADDAFADIVAGRFDAGLRFGESVEKDMVAMRIGPHQRMVMVAAPSFLNGRDAPGHPRELAGYPCIGHRFPSGALYRWELERDGEAMEVAVEGPLTVNDDRLILEAALAGVGLAFVFEALAERELARGELVRVLADWCPAFPGFFLYYPSRRQLRPALRAFIDFFAA